MRAIIVGAHGQDGQLLQKCLREKNYSLTCIDVIDTKSDDVIGLDATDIRNAADVSKLIDIIRPDEIYHLAALHHSAEEKPSECLALYRESFEVNFFSLLNFLESIRLFHSSARLFYAASSHIFGNPPEGLGTDIQNESTPRHPTSVYAMTKADGLLACRNYRESYGLFAAAGILYNHESHYRTPKFLSMKVVRSAVAIGLGMEQQFVVGDLDAKIDWGYAPDYVDAMRLILSTDASDEYIIATGTSHSVAEFVQAAFEVVGISNWRDYVVVDPDRLGRRRRNTVGDSSKLTRATGWKPKTSFIEMVQQLVKHELNRVTE